MYENHHPNTPEVTQEDMNQLFTPFNIGKVQIKNRFCMGPMGISGIQGSLQDWNDVVQEYFWSWAKAALVSLLLAFSLRIRRSIILTPKA